MTDKQLKVILGTITANTMMILQVMQYDKNTPVSLMQEIMTALNATDKVLQIITGELDG